MHLSLDNIEYDVIDCACCWYDLLGFGTPFVNAGWNLHREEAGPSIKRIICEADYFSGPYSSSYAKKLHINDGIVNNYDLDKGIADPIKGLLIFLEAVITDFMSLNTVDKRNGFPGVRGVITLGHRVIYDSTNISRLVNKNMDMCYHPKEFQMNTAFSKASIVEESGSRSGISGPFLYIDRDLFHIVRSYPCERVQYQIMENLVDDEIIMTVSRNGMWLATLVFASATVHYKNRGIDTIFYKLKTCHTIIDDIANESAYQQAKRYSMMDGQD